MGKGARRAVASRALVPEIDTDRVHPRMGSGRVGSGHRSNLRFTAFLSFIFHLLFSYCCHLIGQDSTNQSVVQDQITSNGYK